MNITETLAHLKASAHAESAEHVTIFNLVRYSPTNGRQEVTVEILDSGEGAGDVRYACQGHTADGKVAAPSSAATVEHAISLTHWHKLNE